MPSTARICIFKPLENGPGEAISDILEFEVPDDKAKRRRKLMTVIGKLIDDSNEDDGPTSITVAFNQSANGL